jgi:hypothetical protein
MSVTIDGMIGDLEVVYAGAYTDRESDQSVDYTDYLFVAKMEEKIFLARVAEQAERFDDMVQFLNEAIDAKSGEDFTIDERNLLSVGFKNLIGS